MQNLPMELNPKKLAQTANRVAEVVTKIEEEPADTPIDLNQILELIGTFMGHMQTFKEVVRELRGLEAPTAAPIPTTYDDPSVDSTSPGATPPGVSAGRVYEIALGYLQMAPQELSVSTLVSLAQARKDQVIQGITLELQNLGIRVTNDG